MQVTQMTFADFWMAGMASGATRPIRWNDGIVPGREKRYRIGSVAITTVLVRPSPDKAMPESGRSILAYRCQP